MLTPLEQFEVVRFITINLCHFDISLVNIHVPIILVLVFIIIVFGLFVVEWSLVPNCGQLLVTALYQFVWRIIKSQIGYVAGGYYPFIFCVFSFILFLNLWNLFPYGISVTSHFIIVMYMSIVLWAGILLTGLKNYNLEFLKIFIPNCPFILLFILVPIEIFSYIIRMFSLAIRLVANILAGHTLVYITASLLTVGMNAWLYFIGGGLLCLILILELGDAFLQAYLFTILICIYMNDSLNGVSH